ncbi:response regulator transcription factor [Anaerosphaera multitolerans]|uniref:DNA-binding response regulator n=1 Tax=Anaerosphaera multitolerans TaxID=2487351 RepID=A0A437S9F8_9FIRM|nr:response regulator transcription factor [Anaerosphaera multitolerans]RVU55484.1 DNA-binding response regulator [Anaerosphaera multitolerans]
MENKILLLEDDLSLIDGLEYSLRKNEYSVDVVRSVSEAKKSLDLKEYNLLLLDIGLPDGTGFEVCEYVRAKGNNVPIIFLTAFDEEINVIRGLDSGGDDYITKPFKMGELFSRIRALLRRTKSLKEEEVKKTVHGDITIDYLNSEIKLKDEVLDLTSAEYKLLSLLVQNSGQTVMRETILNRLWDEGGNFVDDNTLSVYIRRLREKLEENPSKPRRIITVRGFGYRYDEVDE